MGARKALALTIAALLMVLMFASCGQKQPGTVVVGLTAPLSGGGAQYGTDCKRGIQMAVDDINEQGGVEIDGTSRQMQLVSLDDKAEAATGVSNAERLVSEKGACAVFCPVAEVIFSLLDINDTGGGDFLLMAYTSIEQVTDEGNELVVMMPPPFTAYTLLFTELAMSQDWKRLAMVQTAGTYGDAWAESMNLAWQSAGGVITVSSRPDYYKESDFVPFLTEALASDPDVLLVGGPTSPTAAMVKQAKELGFTGGFLIMDQAKVEGIADEIGLDNMENCIGVAPVQAPFPATPAFAERYESEYGEPLTWETAINYTSVFVVKDAMENAGSTDPIKVRQALSNALPVSGDEYPVAIDGIENKGLMHMPTAITLVKNGQYTLADQLIYWWEGTR